MYSHTIIFLTITFLIIASSNAKNLMVNQNNHFELTADNASMFLYTNADDSSEQVFNKREVGRNCIPCKFGINQCCDPNICVKKSWWPDECMEIKRANPPRPI
jgi:hypothetical protein